MQILGIYLNSGDPKVIKNLKTEEQYGSDEYCWYPFGEIPDCHNFFTEKFDKNTYTHFLKNINENQNFNHFLYKIYNGPAVNINCIVGKNGSGKSSLLSLEYRIINNLACKVQHYLKSYNQDFTPIWSTGFNAELYYILDEELYQIKVEENKKWKILKKEQNFIGKISLIKINKKHEKENVLENKFNLMDQETDVTSTNYLDYEKNLLKILKKNLFYTVGTNYSLYSNSTVSSDFGTKEELWMNTIFHKNDGYFTPIVLVPYKQDNCATVDTRKELNLAKERITTLSLLVYAETKKNFVENQQPIEYCYQLKEKKSYEKVITNKLINTIRNTENEEDDVSYQDLYDSAFINLIHKQIKEKWKAILFTPEKITEYKDPLINNLDKDVIWDQIQENTLNYLAYKILKMCMFYDEYANRFLDKSNHTSTEPKLKYKVLNKYESDPASFMNIIEELIQELLDPKTATNFMNLKIKQCIKFLNNLDFYIGNKTIKGIFNNKNIIVIDDSKKDSDTFINFINKKNLAYSYDNIFINLLPPYFNKELYFENDKTLASLSSGESQLMNSLSYAVYHIKNASSSNKIGYQYINLVFDEAELYYHPEFQRTFIQKLLGVIERSNFSNVKSINITIVTHSPFILSDIPQTNLLSLTEGTKKDFTTKTLGANFYDLLHNQFFMESSIGAVAEKKINEILKDYNNLNDVKKTKEEKNSIKSKYLPKKNVIEKGLSEDNNNEVKNLLTFVNNLADDYLRTTFQNIIASMQGESYFARRKKELQVKIEKLEILEEQNKK